MLYFLMVFSSIDTDTLIFMVVRSSKICPSLINVPSVITQGGTGIIFLQFEILHEFQKILLPYFLLFKTHNIIEVPRPGLNPGHRLERAV